MRGRVIILVVSLLVVSMTWRWLLLRASGPRFKGNSVEEWLIQYGEAAAQGPERQEAEAALRSLGTSIIPQVIQTLDYAETRRHALFIARMRAIYAWIGIEPSMVDLQPYRLDGAMAALPLLGADARYALPRLVELLERPGPSVGGARAGKVLASLGPIGRPSLIAALDSRDPFVRWRAVMSLDPVGSDAPLIKDYLRKTVQGENIELANAAASVLARTKEDPEYVVQVFIALLDSTNLEIRATAIRRLSEYGHAARDAVPALMNVASNADLYLSQTAISALYTIAPEVLTNFPSASRYQPDPRQLLRFKHGL